jgi:hypothetical protein
VKEARLVAHGAVAAVYALLCFGRRAGFIVHWREGQKGNVFDEAAVT